MSHQTHLVSTEPHPKSVLVILDVISWAAGPLGHGVVFIAKQRFEAIGPRQSRILTFDKGDELLVSNPVQGSEWWEASSLRSGKQGEVPSSYLVRKEENHGNHEQMRYVVCMCAVRRVTAAMSYSSEKRNE